MLVETITDVTCTQETRLTEAHHFLYKDMKPINLTELINSIEKKKVDLINLVKHTNAKAEVINL